MGARLLLLSNSLMFALGGIVTFLAAIEPSADTVERITEGSSSVILLGVAATSIYALLQGKIVPVKAFEKHLEVMQSAIDSNALRIDKGFSQVDDGLTKIAKSLEDIK